MPVTTSPASACFTADFARGPAPEGYEWFTLPAIDSLLLSFSPTPAAKALSCTRCGNLVGDYFLHDKSHEKGGKDKVKTLVGGIGRNGQCPNCGATEAEADRANASGDAIYAVMCGCDFHGDHLGCRKGCKNSGCTQKTGQETVCDHTY